MTNWLVNGSARQFEDGRAAQFELARLAERYAGAWPELAPGDRVIFFIPDLDAVAGVARVTGESGEQDGDLLLEATAVCEPGAYASRAPLARDLDAARAPTGEGPSAPVQLTDADAELLEGAVRLRSGATPTA